MVGRVLKTLEKQGMIETDGKAILIFDASLKSQKRMLMTMKTKMTFLHS